MKNLSLFIVMLLLNGSLLFSQVGINTDNSPPDPSAMLDVKSNLHGMLIPRMTTVERNAIATPAVSLMIFNTTTRCFEAYNSITSGWETIHCFACPMPAAPTAGIHIPSPSQIAWNWNPVSGATGYKWNRTNNYAAATDMGAATTKTETGLTCNTGYTCYAWAYNVCGNSTPVSLTQSTLACFSCGSSFTINHVAGTVAPVTKSVTYGTVTNIPGEPSKCWITRNLGASQQPSACNDATESAAGWYWQYTLKQGYKHDGSIRTPSINPWITSISAPYDWPAANDPCALELGNGWRLPTYTEWNNVDSVGNWNNCNNTYTSGLKLHAAGFLAYYDGSLINRGSDGAYWSSTPGSPGNLGWHLEINSSYSFVTFYPEADAFTLRCLRDASCTSYNTVGVSITPSANPVCAGSPVTFTATPSYGGTTPAYRWKVNGINVGTNSSTYTDNPVNGDAVTCELTSNAGCITGNPAISNLVSMTVYPFPAAPGIGTHVSSTTQIVWNWILVPGAMGYRWNSVNDFPSATDVGPNSFYIEPGLSPNTTYIRFVWAYNSCGISTETLLIGQTLP
jgi:uncharacterized protein (TIGR02145 family)